jgi:hypothetical protein
MNRLFFPLILCMLLLTVCNNNKKTGEATLADKNEKKSIDSNQLQKKLESLQELTLLTPDNIKALLPEQLMGAKGSNYEARSAIGTSVASAEYMFDDSSIVKIDIWDCGGPGGAGYYNRQYTTVMNDQAENEGGYKKVTEFNDNIALELCKEGGNNCSFTYFTGSRFWIVLYGDKTAIDRLKKIAEGLKLK